ncbi:MAG: DEAD/DEAH box helicase [Gammaproteobacteria bacterium]
MNKQATETSLDDLRFEDLKLPETILAAIRDTGYESPSPIQCAAIPPLIAGQDLIGQAQTGTGKTAAFALPALACLDLAIKQPQILVLTPTRELALQVAEAMQRYASHINGFKVLPVYGGQGMDVQLRQLRRGVHAIVGTPGRIQDHIRRGTLKLDGLRFLVLDEADEMLRMGFVDDVEEILSHTPGEKQIALFSATMPGPIRKIAKRHLRDPVEIKIKAKSATVSTVRQRYCQVTAKSKLDALTRILEVENFDAMVIFVRTKTATVELAEKLAARGFSSSPINGDMNQAMRERTVTRLKQGSLDILIATDVAARGLDVDRISHVINYDIPHDTESYIHRIGRTARAGRSGETILFVAPREKRMLAMIEKATGREISLMPLPSEEEIADRRVASFHALISKTIEAEELGPFEEVILAYQQNHSCDITEIAAALAFLSQKERPLYPTFAPLQEPKKKHPKDRGEKKDQKPYKEPSKSVELTTTEPGMVRYRLAVGAVHEVEVKNIVGAIANEAGIDNEHIGKVIIQDNHTLIDLPEGMPKDIYQHLRKVRVCGQKLRISLADAEYDNPPAKPKDGQRKPETARKPARKSSNRKGNGRKRDSGSRPKSPKSHKRGKD